VVGWGGCQIFLFHSKKGKPPIFSFLPPPFLSPLRLQPSSPPITPRVGSGFGPWMADSFFYCSLPLTGPIPKTPFHAPWVRDLSVPGFRAGYLFFAFMVCALDFSALSENIRSKSSLILNWTLYLKSSRFPIILLSSTASLYLLPSRSFPLSNVFLLKHCFSERALSVNSGVLLPPPTAHNLSTDHGPSFSSSCRLYVCALFF